MAKKLLTGKVRFSYLNAFKPKAMEEGAPEVYSVSLLIPKSDKAQVEKIKKLQDEVARELWGSKIPSKLKYELLRDGDDREQPEYEGHWYINAKSESKPGFVDADREPILSATDVKSGDYGRAHLTVFAFDNKFGKGISCRLENLQFLESGEALGSERESAEDVFADEDDDI